MCRAVHLGPCAPAAPWCLCHGARGSFFESLHDMSARQDAWTTLVAGFLFPWEDAMKGRSSVVRMHELEKSQWLSRDRIESERTGRLKALLVHVHLHVPYYRRIIDE